MNIDWTTSHDQDVAAVVLLLNPVRPDLESMISYLHSTVEKYLSINPNCTLVSIGGWTVICQKVNSKIYTHSARCFIEPYLLSLSTVAEAQPMVKKLEEIRGQR